VLRQLNLLSFGHFALMASKIVSRTAFDGLAVDEGEESDVEDGLGSEYLEIPSLASEP
jgi:hypothetical protein